MSDKFLKKFRICFARNTKRLMLNYKREFKRLYFNYFKLLKLANIFVKTMRFSLVLITFVSVIAYTKYYLFEVGYLPRFDFNLLLTFGYVCFVYSIFIGIIPYVMIEFVVLLACKRKKSNKFGFKILNFLYERVFLLFVIIVIIIIELVFLSLVQIYQNENVTFPTINHCLNVMMAIFITLCFFVYFFKRFSLIIKIIWIICSIWYFFSLDIKVVKLANIGGFRTDIVVSKNSLYMSYFINYKKLDINDCDIKKGEKNICKLSDGNYVLKDVLILSSLSDVVYIELNLNNKAQTLDFKQSEIEIINRF
ncbi:hypothetical protein AVBRAN12640_05460 [Campylobacter sp. RM12640]|uniref:hypothetical protein n=1 Tax=unclassified Campylobacter TaxID=2593542 RepID=UPI0030144FEB|nr:hypothetical protein [Campylobacter sp. RM12640]MBZ7989638.1 hypothetical protein [Campylobacter sp. RM12635]